MKSYKPKHLAKERKKKRYLGVLLAGIVLYLLLSTTFGISIVEGSSMCPNIWPNDIVLFFRFSTYQAGDIVLLELEQGESGLKRIVGMPGQQIEIDTENGEVIINGAPLPEPYLYEQTVGKTGVEYPLVLGDGEYFLLGDHRGNSLDSRNYGAVQESKLQGKVIALFRMGISSAD